MRGRWRGYLGPRGSQEPGIGNTVKWVLHFEAHLAHPAGIVTYRMQTELYSKIALSIRGPPHHPPNCCQHMDCQPDVREGGGNRRQPPSTTINHPLHRIFFLQLSQTRKATSQTGYAFEPFSSHAIHVQSPDAFSNTSMSPLPRISAPSTVPLQPDPSPPQWGYDDELRASFASRETNQASIT